MAELVKPFDASEGPADENGAVDKPKVSVEVVKVDPPGARQTAKPIIELSPFRFALSVVTGNVLLVGFMIIFLFGVTLKSNIVDPIGSSSAADKQVELFQTLNGYFTAVIGEFLEMGFEIFIVVILTCLGHVGCGYAFFDQENAVGGRLKAMMLFGFGPAVFFVLNVGISAMNIQHSITGVSRAFVGDDLAAASLSISSTNATTTNIKDTIMRPVVLNRVMPFDLLANSSCISSTSSENATTSVIDYVELPTVRDIRSTAVVFGFPAQSWNYRALPNALTPTYEVNVSLGDLASSDTNAVADFQDATDFDYYTMYDLFLQGKTLLERSISDSNVSAQYPCSWSDGKTSDDVSNASSSVGESTDSNFAYFTDGDYAGMRVCNGAVSSLKDLETVIDGSTTYHNLNSFAGIVMDGMSKTIAKIAPAEIKMRLQTFQLSRQMSVMSMTLYVPLTADAQYRDVGDYCYSNNTILPEYTDSTWSSQDLEEISAIYCNQTFYPYGNPRATCGATNCVFLDKSGLLPLKKQILMIPFLTNCSVSNMTYDSDYLNFLPTDCITPPEGNEVFLYGTGSYMAGEVLDSGLSDGATPYILGPRRHLVFSFAKLQWTTEDISSVFTATCEDSDASCSGLVHVLHNLTAPNSLTVQALVVGNSSLPTSRFKADFRHPMPLVTLNSPPFWYKSANAYFEWEYLDRDRFDYVNWNKSQSLGSIGCSVLIDSYISQLENNHYRLDEPLQPMYASALFYLFQNAAVKNVQLSSLAARYENASLSASMGTARFDGDRERKEIKYTIPVASAIATYIGIGILLVLLVLVLVVPTDRVKISETSNLAARYAEILSEEEYPEQVHDRKLEIAGSVNVDMDEHQIESVEFSWEHGSVRI